MLLPESESDEIVGMDAMLEIVARELATYLETRIGFIEWWGGIKPETRKEIMDDVKSIIRFRLEVWRRSPSTIRLKNPNEPHKIIDLQKISEAPFQVLRK